MSTDAKKIAFVSLGCAKNLVDTEVMMGQLTAKGHELTPDPSQADVIVVNTCSFIDPAKQEALRDKVKVAELEAERLQQEGLYAVTQSGPPLGTAAEPTAAARANIAALAGALGKTFPKASVDVLIGGFTSAA